MPGKSWLPGHARAHYNLGVALEKIGCVEEAAEAYETSASMGYFRKDEALRRAAFLKGRI